MDELDRSDGAVRWRRSLLGGFAAARPTSPEEVEFVRGFANALTHATAMAAAEPQTPLPRESLAERVRVAYVPFRPGEQDLVRERARIRLSAPVEERRGYFGDYADWTPDTARSLDDAVRAQLKRAVRARLQRRRSEIEEFLSASGVASSMAAWGTPRTWLETGYFTGDVIVSWTELTINSPAKLQFRWWTEEVDAERGLWQLLRVDPGKKEVLLASGDAGDAPGPRLFTLDLGKYLPAQPPAVPSVYHVRVSPQTKAKILPGSTPGLAGPKVAGKAVGPRSNPVVITYSAISSPPVDFTIHELYRSLEIGLDKIHLVEDQSGGGGEEFWVAGFVQEFLPSGSANKGQQVKFGPRYAALDPGGNRWADIAVTASFWLDNPDTQDWPRAYALVVSALEEDDGGAFNDWHAQLGDLANEFLVGQTNADVTEYLQEQFEQFLSDNWEQILQQAPAVADFIIGLISSSVAGMVGMVLAVVALVVAAIIAGADDDFYGVGESVLALPTNVSDFIEGHYPGQHTSVPLEGYQLDTEPIPLFGHGSFFVAANYDGKVEIYHDCIISNLETF